MGKQIISGALSTCFSNMSFLCACMIVFFHATPAPDKGSFNWWFFHMFGREGICCIAVPYFFACSGFFLAGHIGEPSWWAHEVRKRVRSLVVPFFIWMLIGLAFGLLVSYAKNAFFHVENTSDFLMLPTWEKIVLFVGLHPYRDIGVLWYVRTLFFLVVASPVIFAALRRPIFMLSVLSVLHLILSYLFAEILDLDMYFLFDRFVSIRGLLYFTAGAALRVGLWDIDVCRPSTCLGLGCFCTGMSMLVVKNFFHLESYYGYSAIVESVAVPFLIIFCWWIASRCGRLRYVSYSFPIFLMHNIFLSLVSMLYMAIGLREHLGMQIIIAFSRAGCAIVGSILVVILIRRISPRFANVLLGGR